MLPIIIQNGSHEQKYSCVPNSQVMENSLIVRINGTLPDLSIMGDEEKSEKAAEVKKMEIALTHPVRYIQ